MEVQETLNTIAEIVVAVAGFTAVMITVTTILISVSLLVISIGLWMEANATILILALIWTLVLQGYGFISNLVWAASRE